MTNSLANPRQAAGPGGRDPGPARALIAAGVGLAIDHDLAAAAEQGSGKEGQGPLRALGRKGEGHARGLYAARRALAPAQRWARSRVISRAGLGAQAGNDEIAAAARSFGCTTDEISALLTPVVDDASILALGRAVARVGGNARVGRDTGEGRMQ